MVFYAPIAIHLVRRVMVLLASLALSEILLAVLLQDTMMARIVPTVDRMIR